jgi:hypothetical protein
MSVRRIRSGRLPGCDHNFPPGRNRRARSSAAAVIELAKWNASTHKIVSALPPARPVSVKSACLEADATTSTRMGCTLLD